MDYMLSFAIIIIVSEPKSSMKSTHSVSTFQEHNPPAQSFSPQSDQSYDSLIYLCTL